MSRIGKFTDNNYWFPGTWGEKRWGVTANGRGASLWSDRNALALDRGELVQFSEYTKKPLNYIILKG